MKVANVKLRSVSPVTFGRFYQTEKLSKELPDAYEKRTWRERLHYDDQGFVFIPGNMICNALRESCKFMSMQIPGKGKATYTKHLDAGIMPKNDIKLKVKKSDVEGQPVHVPSDGKPGGTSRVMKIFPKIFSWEGWIEIIIMDDIITADVLEAIIRNAGMLIGIGTFRPRNRGTNGRFELVEMKWSEN